MDALFTATSATTVTGLIVVDTASSWTLAGQIVIALLIILGGIGFMTGAAFFLIAAGQSLDLLYENKELKPWHHLISGSKESVHNAKMSVRNSTMSENNIPEKMWQDYITNDYSSLT